MKTYTCDVCGRPFDPRSPDAVLSEHTGAKTTNVYLRPYMDDADVCPSCVHVGNSLPVREIIFSAWRDAARATKEAVPV